MKGKFDNLVDYLNGVDSTTLDIEDTDELKERIVELELTIDNAKNELEKYLDNDVIEEIFG